MFLVNRLAIIRIVWDDFASFADGNLGNKAVFLRPVQKEVL